METFIHIENGAVTNRKVLANIIQNLTNGRWLLKITKANKRSLNQNAYYWGVVLPLVKDGLKEIGYNEVRTIDDAHEVLKELFLKKVIANENTGECIQLNGSTAKLSTLDFMAFIESIQQWAVEFLNIQVPSPNEQLIAF